MPPVRLDSVILRPVMLAVVGALPYVEAAPVLTVVIVVSKMPPPALVTWVEVGGDRLVTAIGLVVDGARRPDCRAP